MASFFTNKDPVATAAAAVVAAVKAGVGLRNQLNDAKAQLDTATATANRLANDGADNATLQKAEAAVTEAGNIVKRRLLAVETKDAEIRKLEAARDEAVDHKQRSATVVDCQQLEAELAKEGDIATASALRMSVIAARIIPIAPEANGLKNFADISVEQIPEAVALLSRLIRDHSAAVLRRELPSTLKKPEAPYVPPAVVEPVRTTLFCMRSLKYVDPDSGKSVVIQKFRDGEFPPEHAKAALDLNICVRLSDPLRRQHFNTYPGNADPTLALDLDAAMNAPKPPAASAAPSSLFTVVDRGPGTTIKHREPDAMFGDVR